MLEQSEGVSRPQSPAPNLPRSAGRSSSGDAASDGALGINVKYVGRAERHERNLARFAAKWSAAKMLQGHDDKLAARLSHCGYVARAFDVTLQRDGATGAAGFDGLKTCASVWCCPCCSPRISGKRADELNELLAGARAEKLAVVMLTLTARHDRRMRLAPFLDALKRALQKLRQRRDWKALKPLLVGSVTATEVTHGRNGWHPHFHVLLVLDAPQQAALDAIEGLRSGWLASLSGVGLSGEKAAFDVQSADAAGQYVAKFGAAEELALHGAKQGRKGSRSPWQLLDDARDGDAQAAGVWIEYALAFRGRRQLVWSNGLKARFGIGETSDDEAAAEIEPVPAWDTVRAWIGSSEAWRAARRRRVALVQAAESGGCLDAAEHGATDRERWRRFGGDLVIEGNGND